MVVKTWDDIWASPMASQFVDADFHGIYRIAVLTQAFMRSPTAAISAELRQLSYCFGLSPMDRRRLQWTIAKAEEAGDAAERRRASAARIIEHDPRDTLGKE